MDKRPLPSSYKNGHVREDHAPRSVFFRQCPEEGELREFQLSTVDNDRGVSVFRCVICGYRIEVKHNNSAQAEGEN